MTVRARIDRALASIGFEPARGGRGTFRARALTGSDGPMLAVRVGASGREVVARRPRSSVRIDRWGHVTTQAPAPPHALLHAPAAAMATTLAASDIHWRLETAAPVLETIVASVTPPSSRLRERLARLLALRLGGPAARTDALVASCQLAEYGGLELAIAGAAGELLPELFVRAREPIPTHELVAMSWFPPMLPRLERALRGCDAAGVELALSPELGLGLTIELPEAAPLTELPTLRVGNSQLAILAAVAETLPPTAQFEFEQAILSNDIAPLPGLTPSASRAHARALGRDFARRGRLPREPLRPSHVQRIADRSRVLGIERSVVLGAAG